MFSPALGRVVRSTSSIVSPGCTLIRPATLSAVQQTLSRPSHQRRLSSSKASIPPDGPKDPLSEEQVDTKKGAKKDAKKNAKKDTVKASTRKRAAAPPALNVPHVPPTDYLEEPGMHILDS